MFALEIACVLLILVLKGQICISQITKEAPALTLKKCIQTEDLETTCEEFKPDPGEMLSQWPPGPYATPMTRYGCPESSLHGWREGYLSFNWHKTESVHVRTRYLNINSTEVFTTVTKEEPFRISDRHILISTSPSSIKLYFCYKHRSNSSLDIGTWPDEAYSIYSTQNSCPLDFEKITHNVSLPKSTRRHADGYLPDFKIFSESSKDILQLSLCSRKKASIEDPSEDTVEGFAFKPDSSLYRNWTCFFLIKDEYEPCPTLQHSVVFEETVFFKEGGFFSSYMEQMSDTLCYYETDAFPADTENWLFETRVKNAYKGYIGNITEGHVLGFTFSWLEFRMVNVDYHWISVDFGRTIAVSAVDIWVYTDCVDVYSGCFISGERWSFLHSEALSCLYTPICRLNDMYLSMVFKRIMEGRYVTLVNKLDAIYKLLMSAGSLESINVNVYTEILGYDGSGGCNYDLGMRDLSIRDDQISASSSLSEFPPLNARPYHAGWCPNFNDEQPFLQIVFPEVKTIDGITVFNTREVTFFPEMEKLVLFAVASLTLTYSESNDSNVYNQTIHFDASNHDKEERSARLLRPIRAKIVKLFIQKSPGIDLTCLRFELHGCRHTEKFTVFDTFKRYSQTMTYEILTYASEIRDFGTVLTSIGFPAVYPSSQSNKWLIRFPEFHYIKLIFGHIKYREMQGLKSLDSISRVCNDSIIISHSIDEGNPFYSRYEVKFAASIETKETMLVLTFVSCFTWKPIHLGNGFRAVVTYQEIPACFSLSAVQDFYGQSKETCRHPAMFITSMSYLGHPFKHTTEQWIISIPTKRINVQILEFDVPCNNGNSDFEFWMISMQEETSYCNINRPPSSFNSSFDTLTIVFYEGNSETDAHVHIMGGFRMFYSVIEEPDESLMDYMDNHTEVRNVALGKVTYGSTQSFSTTYTDGQTRTCISGYSSEFLILDLQEIYTLEYVVLYGLIGRNQFLQNVSTCVTTLMTGVSVFDLKTTGLHCGKIDSTGSTIVQTGITSRYIQLLQVRSCLMGLCEIKVYGKLESGLHAALSSKGEMPLNVYGEWGEWSTWTDVCYCEGKQFRRRYCDSPQPQIIKDDCPGEKVSHRSCKGVSTPCEVYSEAATEKEYLSCRVIPLDNNGYSSWSDWSSCSSECGNGLISRTKRCTHPENQCFGDIIDSRPCIGNGSCRVCSSTFAKCYSIVARYTNWQQARLECLKRKMTIGSILSLSEMRFVKYLLLKRRSIDGLPTDYFDAGFYVHIGLRLENSVPIWENGVNALYFTAWKKQEPSKGLCTRMNFRFYDDDNTWESEDCQHQLAEYTLCEYQLKKSRDILVKTLNIWTDAERVDVSEQMEASQYDGEVKTTISGRSCSNGSYCRDYLNRGYLTCLNTDGYYEECSVNLPSVQNSSIVYHTYLGKLNTTFSGKTCQRWDSQDPHMHYIHGNLFKGEGISEAANYCRDLDNSGLLWCHTTDIETVWESCLINEIKAERRCTNNRKYTGKQNTTVTGKSCLRWEGQVHEFQGSVSNTTSLRDADNFCRDPYGVGYNWCYTFINQYRQESEPCIIEEPDTSTVAFEISHEVTPEDKFICETGEEIPHSFKCDGKFDCKNGSDETECFNVFSVHPMIKNHSDVKSSEFEVGSYFKCGSNELVSVVAHCDGVIDCLDASDEINCYYNSFGEQDCTREQFKCKNGDCIHVSQVCNSKDDCTDGSDEYCDIAQCSHSTEFRCKSEQCIPLEYRCDAIRQCPDGSDETDCDECQPNIAFHCDVARCIPMRLTCDKYAHCEDGTDEESCDTWNCNTCQEVWEAGYRKSGSYIFGDGVRAECYFEHIFKKSKMKTLFYLDFFYSSGTILESPELMFYNIPSLMHKSGSDSLTFDKDNSSCYQQIKQLCVPSYEDIVEASTTSACYCGIISFEIKEGAQGYYRLIEECPKITYNNKRISRDSLVLNHTLISYVQYNKARWITFVNSRSRPNYLVLPGPAVCTHEFVYADNDYSCNINGKNFPTSQRCLYDIDKTGYPTGCTDGSHLIDCENYTCPQNTLKCPNSYCIPQRYLCDGELQCPGGEDEDKCGCEPSTNEILIIYDAETDKGPNINLFARQLKSLSNIVRVLSYKASKPLQPYGINNVLLEVHDVEISRVPDLETLFECRYKIMATTLLDSIHFTNEGTKGVILLRNSEMSTYVFTEIIESVPAKKVDFKIYRVSQIFDEFTSERHNRPANFTDIQIRRWRHLNGVGAEYFSELCKVTTKVHCPNGYKCAASKTCIALEQICDDHIQCLHGDDELLCNFQCPDNCTCTGFFSNCSAIDFKTSMIYTIPKNTRYLDLSLNRNVSSVLQAPLLNIMLLSVLNVSSCDIESLSRYAFIRISNLLTLDLSFNRLRTLSDYVFSELVHLNTLNLRGNFELSVIETHAFHGLSQIQDLDLANAKLSKVYTDSFAGLKLKTLDLSNNKIEEIEMFAFRDSSVEDIYFESNVISRFNKEIFTGLIGLKRLRTPAFKFCCVRPSYVAEHNCYPHKDEFSSCDDLLRYSGLQFMIWLIGISGLVGNILTLFYRIKYDKERLKLGFGIFVTNLAMADFLMAIYVMFIAVADSAFRKRYIFVDDYWRHSVWCSIAGVLSTTSSEASALFLCLITLDRLLVIKFPFGRVKLTTKISVLCAVSVWLFSAFVAILPVAYQGYFQKEFYSKSGVCIALPLTRDRPPGWAYSLGLFVFLNFLTFILVAFGQVSIFIEIRKSTGIATSVASVRKRDLKVARNLLLVVATDFLCWFPIGVMGILALSGHAISGEVYAWTAVFILPVNSALNPLLYTLSSIIGAKTFKPSVEEQSFAVMTKDIGESSKKCLIYGHLFARRTILNKFKDLNALSEADLHITVDAIVRIDDAAIMSDTREGLQESLDNLYSYCQK